MELHKNLTLDPTSNPSSTATTLTSNPMAIPLNQLVKPHLALAAASAVPSSAALFATDLNNFSSQARPKPLTTKLRATPHTAAISQPPHGLENGNKAKADRKFAPY